MRVALVCHRYRPFFGGVETHVNFLAQGLAKYGVNVEVFTTDPSGQLPRKDVVNGIVVRRYSAVAPSEAYYLSIPLFKGLLSLRDFDIVHAHNYGAFPMTFASLAKYVNQLPVVLTPHFHPTASTMARNIFRRVYSPAGKLALRRADAIIALTAMEKLDLARIFGLRKEQVVIIPHGIPVPANRNGKRNSTILVVSRLEKYKGLNSLFPLMSKLGHRFKEARILVVGDGPARAELETRAAHTERIQFLGNITRAELSYYYETSAMLLSMSSYEAFGMSILEAMAHGCPVVATAVGAVPHIIEDARTGLLVKYPIDVDEVSDAIARILSQDSFAEFLGSNSRQLVRKRYSPERMLRQTLGLYREVRGF